MFAHGSRFLRTGGIVPSCSMRLIKIMVKK